MIGVLDKPILSPNEEYEIHGSVDNVVFACGAVVEEEKDEIRVYYGAADTCTCLAIGSFHELMEALKNSDDGIHL